MTCGQSLSSSIHGFLYPYVKSTFKIQTPNAEGFRKWDFPTHDPLTHDYLAYKVKLSRATIAFLRHFFFRSLS
jgi:hypothetical protein